MKGVSLLVEFIICSPTAVDECLGECGGIGNICEAVADLAELN